MLYVLDIDCHLYGNGMDDLADQQEWENVVKRLHDDDPFFQDGDRFCSLPSRQTLLINFDEEDDTADLSPSKILCSESGCKQIFMSVSAFDVHYNICHRNECTQCHRRFPTSHLVEIHILENHDAHFMAMATQKPIYRCFLESCPVKSWDIAQRRQHAITDHYFPVSFRFFEVRKSTSSQMKMEVEETQESKKAHNPSKARVPKNVCFGRGSVRGFHRGTRGKLSVKDLQQAIDEI